VKNAIAVFPSQGYRTFFLCLVCGIVFSVSAPVDLQAQALPAPLSLNTNENESLIYMNWDGLDPERTQQTSSLATSDVSAKPEVKSSNPEGGESASQSLAPVDTKTEPEKTQKKNSRGALVPAPLPIVSPAIGKGIIPGLGYIFPFSKNDKLSPPSVVGAAGMFTDNGSRGFGVGADLYMKEDTYEITAMYGQGNVNYNLYGSGIFSGRQLPLEQSGHLFRGELLRRLWWKFFLGPRFWSGNSFLTLRPNNGKIPPLPSDFGIHTTMRALGMRLTRDTRPNQFYPTAGEKIEFTSDFFMKSLGSKYSFQAYRFVFDKYLSLGKNQVLAYDLFACATSGQPPFYGNCVYGTSSELRGYTAGKYFDRYMAATQVEYRLTLPWGFGLAAFGGLGGVVPGSSQVLFKNSHFLPDIGGGPRYELSKKYHVNLRTDFARGRDSWNWSMGVGEAF
jgi:Omp85 superfamily domain